jgi:hypothetical protein
MRARPQPRRLVAAAVLTGTGVVLAAAPGAAAAPSLQVQRCALARPAAQVPFLAEGLQPGAGYRLRVSGTTVRRGTVAADGSVEGRFRVPRLSGPPTEQTRQLSISDGTATARSRIRLTTFGVRIVPRPVGRSPRERFRFGIYGFEPGGTIYLHYVRPNGTLERTFALGAPKGPCGALLTPPRVLFPFAPREGTWRLQFDKTKRYRRNAPAPRSRIALPIRTRGG